MTIWWDSIVEVVVVVVAATTTTTTTKRQQLLLYMTHYKAKSHRNSAHSANRCVFSTFLNCSIDRLRFYFWRCLRWYRKAKKDWLEPKLTEIGIRTSRILLLSYYFLIRQCNLGLDQCPVLTSILTCPLCSSLTTHCWHWLIMELHSKFEYLQCKCQFIMHSKTTVTRCQVWCA